MKKALTAASMALLLACASASGQIVDPMPAQSAAGADTQAATVGSTAVTLRNGDTVVAYVVRMDSPQKGTYLISMKRLAANGVQVQGETLVSSMDFSLRRPIQVTEILLEALPDGGFVVGWSYDWVSSVSAGHTLYNQRYDEQGRPLGSPFVAAASDARAK